MRILIDECVPRRFAREVVGYDVSTMQQIGWLGKKNGELLKLLVEHSFDVFITVDQNLQYQQNLKDTKISIIVLSSSTNRYDDLKSLAPSVLKRLSSLVAGEIYIISE
jgi:hypothetical protein